MTSDNDRAPLLASRSPLISWLAVAGLGLPLIVAFELMDFPAAVLVGSMVASIAVAVSGGKARLHRNAFLAAQGIVGCLIEHGVPASALGAVAAHNRPRSPQISQVRAARHSARKTARSTFCWADSERPEVDR